MAHELTCSLLESHLRQMSLTRWVHTLATRKSKVESRLLAANDAEIVKHIISLALFLNKGNEKSLLLN